jgi:hypothetical protein
MGPLQINKALSPKKSNLLPALLLIIGLIGALSAAAYGYLESRRTETVLIAVRQVPFGQQLVADDLATIELPLHRPIQLAGIGDPNLVLGRWAAREIGSNDLIQPTMLLAQAPDQPVYPSGQQLDKDTVAVPFSTQTIGPLTHHDFVNVGYNDPNGDMQTCLANGGSAVTEAGALTIAPAPAISPAPDGSQRARPFACRLLSRVKVLWVDEAQNRVFLQMTPYQSHTIWALQAAQTQLWGERYGSSSDELPSLDRLDAAQVDAMRLTLNTTDTLKLYSPQGFGGAIPGASSPIPGQQPPIAPEPTAAPAP